MEADNWRQLDFFDPAKSHPKVVVIGCGHIGSYAAFGLARLGVKDITVVDHDMVEPHNLPNQFFAESLVKDLPNDKPSLYKVVALQKTIQYLIPTAKITPVPMKVEAAEIDISTYPVVLVAVDDMNVRKWIWNKVCSMSSITKFLIDARTGGEFANVFGIVLGHPQSHTVYDANLFDNSKAAELPCTGTAVIDVSLGVISDCINKYRQFVKTKQVKVIHSFHDYVVGTVSIMAMRSDDKIKTPRVVETPGVVDGDNVKESENGR